MCAGKLVGFTMREKQIVDQRALNVREE